MSTMNTTYTYTVQEVGAQTVEAKNIAEAAAKAVAVWGDDAVTDVRREASEDRERIADAIGFYIARVNWSSADAERAEFERIHAEHAA